MDSNLFSAFPESTRITTVLESVFQNVPPKENDILEGPLNVFKDSWITVFHFVSGKQGMLVFQWFLKGSWALYILQDF